ncbi:MAG: acylphosphatase [Candidatus Marinimicrobia bacterium]|nr:acylphosphatase [Candidatus Neomarinimicrobiota bacterium]
MVILKAKIYGKVQGVWFRKYTYDFAKCIGLVGIVKNLEDGSVLAKVSGRDDKLEQFKEFLVKGSPDSRVDKIDYSWQDSSTEYLTFEIES